MHRSLMNGHNLLLLAFCMMCGLSGAEATKRSIEDEALNRAETLNLETQVKRSRTDNLNPSRLKSEGSGEPEFSSSWEELYEIIRHDPVNIINNPARQAEILTYYFQNFYWVEPATLADLIPSLKTRAVHDPKALWLLIQAEVIGTSNPVSQTTIELIKALKGIENNEARLILGRCYLQGLGLEENKTEGFNVIKLAADEGDASAQCALGKCYFNGHGVEKDQGEAVRWSLKAAEQGHALAQYNLGVACFHNQGIKSDLDKALHWFHKSAEQGYVLAQRWLGEIYFEGNGGEEAFHWFRKAAEQGDTIAQRRLGEMYFTGKEIQEDPVKATYWFHQAAEQGDAKAYYSLGWIYLKGLGVKENAKTSFWFSLVANKASSNLNQPLDKIKRVYMPMLVRNPAGNATHHYALKNSLLNTWNNLSMRLEKLSDTIGDTEEGRQGFKASLLPLYKPKSLIQLQDNLNELQKTLKTTLPRALTKVGFFITNLTFARDLNGAVENPYMQYFNIKGKEYLCLGDKNVSFARNMFKLFSETEKRIKTTTRDIRSAICVFEGLLTMKASMQKQDRTVEELTEFYQKTVAMLNEVKASVKEAKDFVEEEIAAAAPRSNEVFVKEFDACFD